jgi:hypothetical protein
MKVLKYTETKKSGAFFMSGRTVWLIFLQKATGDCSRLMNSLQESINHRIIIKLLNVSVKNLIKTLYRV